MLQFLKPLLSRVASAIDAQVSVAAVLTDYHELIAKLHIVARHHDATAQRKMTAADQLQVAAQAHAEEANHAAQVAGAMAALVSPATVALLSPSAGPHTGDEGAGDPAPAAKVAV